MKMANESEADNSGTISRPDTFVIINCALNASMMLIAIIGNTLVLSAILKTPSLRSPSTVFLIGLAVSDLLVGLVVQPVYIANALTNDSLIELQNITSHCACAVSLATMTSISVDRFLALHYHMRYPNFMTTHRAMYILATHWLASITLPLLVFWNMNAYYIAGGVGIGFCLSVSSGCYIQIYRIVRQHQLQIHAQQQAVERLNAAENNQNLQRSKNSAKSTFIFYIVMLVCYTPLFISMIIFSFDHINLTKARALVSTVVYTNSSINPFLYCWRLRDLRATVVKISRQMFCTQTEET